jgi:4-hydroxy-3-methylbut-2-enyl diphosphate reductase
VIAFLEQFDPERPETWEIRRTLDPDRLLPRVKSKPKSAD